MKLIKVMGFSLGAVFLLFIAVGLFLPASTQVSRSVTIDRDVSAVFNMVNDFREFNKWSPWAKRDEQTRYEYSGPASGLGAKMLWFSDHPQVGNGSQEIIESIPYERVAVRLTFDGQGEAQAFYQIEPANDGTTRITWGFNTRHGFNIISRYFGLMLDTWVGADYEQGLNSLKSLLED